ncbi:MAG: hypothetical protein O3C63_00945 [Cyanobacteria bacterium]|nr:hypothetical protein [Cyanobacteriota bacterium]MDA1020508.1 hypothetical protein [Cyanobacteriota bacterium]
MQVAEALDFSPILDYGQASSKRARPAGEFELSDFNDPTELHAMQPISKIQVKSEKQDDIHLYNILKKSTDFANVINIITNSLSALVNSSRASKNNKLVNMTADIGAKLSMGINSIFNIYNGHKQKEVFNVAGYLSELVIAMFAPRKIMGLLRGLAFTLYQIPNFVTSMAQTSESKSYGDNFKMVSSRMSLALKKILTLDTYKNLSDNFGLLSGTWGGIFSGAGVLTWLLTGSTKAGGWIKGIGEILVDSFQLGKDHWACKRTNYINSGLSFIMGSLCEMASKQKNNEPVTMALYFVGSGIGRMFMTWSNTNGERNYPVGGPRVVS